MLAPVPDSVRTSLAATVTLPSAWYCARVSDRTLLVASSWSTPAAASAAISLGVRAESAVPVPVSVTVSLLVRATVPSAWYWATLRLSTLSVASIRSIPASASAAISLAESAAILAPLSARVITSPAASVTTPNAWYWSTVRLSTLSVALILSMPFAARLPKSLADSAAMAAPVSARVTVSAAE